MCGRVMGRSWGVTARHPVWSVDRGDWVSVGDLEPGETLETLDRMRSTCEKGLLVSRLQRRH